MKKKTYEICIVRDTKMMNEKDYKIVGIGIKSKSNVDWTKLSSDLKQYLISNWSGQLEYNFIEDKGFVILKIKRCSFGCWEGIAYQIKMWVKKNYTNEKFGIVMMGREIKHRPNFEDLPIEEQERRKKRAYEKAGVEYKGPIIGETK
jgi:hypothetical protein